MRMRSLDDSDDTASVRLDLKLQLLRMRSSNNVAQTSSIRLHSEPQLLRMRSHNDASLFFPRRSNDMVVARLPIIAASRLVSEPQSLRMGSPSDVSLLLAHRPTNMVVTRLQTPPRVFGFNLKPHSLRLRSIYDASKPRRTRIPGNTPDY